MPVVRTVRAGELTPLPDDLPPGTQMRIVPAKPNSGRILKVVFVLPGETVLEIETPHSNNAGEGQATDGR